MLPPAHYAGGRVQPTGECRATGDAVRTGPVLGEQLDSRETPEGPSCPEHRQGARCLTPSLRALPWEAIGKLWFVPFSH